MSYQDLPRRPTILVAEDEALIRDVLIDFLDDVGFSVVEAGNAADALAEIDKRDVDLVVTDINMPGKMDGTDLAEWLADHRPGLPVILTSGRAAPVQRDAARRRFIAKPYRLGDLELQIRDLLH